MSSASIPQDVRLVKHRAELYDIGVLSFDDVERVAAYLLETQGYGGTHDWFRLQFGARYSFERTEDHLRRIEREQGF